MPRLRTALLALTLGLLVPAAIAQDAPDDAADKVYELSNFDVTLALRTGGTYAVDETLRYDFQRGTFTYAYRSIDLDGVEAVRNVRVTSPDAAVDSVQTTEGDDRLRVRWTFPERSAPATFRIRYDLVGALYERGNRNVVRRDIMAPEAVVTTRDVDVQVALPPSFSVAPGAVTVEPDSDGRVVQDAGQVVARFRRDRVDAGDDYAVEVSFPKQVAAAFLPTVWHIAGGVLLIALGLGGGWAAQHRARGPRPDVTARRPPRDVDLPTAAVLLQSRSEQAFAAMLFDLAKRDHLTLIHDQEDVTFGTHDVVRFDLHADRAELSDPERAFLDELAAYDTLGDFWLQAQGFRKEQGNAIRDALVARGWLRSRVALSNALLGGAVLSIGGGVVGAILASGAGAFFAFMGGVGVSLGCCVAAVRRRVWTEEGARRGMALRSFLDYETAEIERLREADPVGAAERLTDRLPWLMLSDDVSSAWIEEVADALGDAHEAPEVPSGFVSRVTEGGQRGAAGAAFLHIFSVVSATEASGAGATGAAGGGAAGGGGGAAGAE